MVSRSPPEYEVLVVSWTPPIPSVPLLPARHFPPNLTHSLTHKYVHTLVSHTQIFHAKISHTQISLTPISHRQISHIQISHARILTHRYLTVSHFGFPIEGLLLTSGGQPTRLKIALSLGSVCSNTCSHTPRTCTTDVGFLDGITLLAPQWGSAVECGGIMVAPDSLRNRAVAWSFRANAVLDDCWLAARRR